MTHVTFFGHTYRLPTVVNKRFCRLQQRVNEQSRRMQEGVHCRASRFRRRSFAAAPVSPETYFQELSRLIHNYDVLIDAMRESKKAYELFFAQLAAGVRQALHHQRL